MAVAKGLIGSVLVGVFCVVALGACGSDQLAAPGRDASVSTSDAESPPPPPDDDAGPPDEVDSGPLAEDDAGPAPLEDSGPIAVPDLGRADAGSRPDSGPVSGDCYAQLDALGVRYTRTTARGVVNAVRLGGDLAGVQFVNGTSTAVTSDPMACEFVRTLHRFATMLAARGFVKVGTLGSYCYRCCCAWSQTNMCRGVNDPEPTCTQGYSNHSWGRAVDVRYLTKSNGMVYDVNNPAHFVINASGTCTGALAAQTGISREMYEVACQASAMRIFATTLTPNYNAVHRNHFHMDIGQTGTPTGFVTRSLTPNVDEGEHLDACGGAD